MWHDDDDGDEGFSSFCMLFGVVNLFMAAAGAARGHKLGQYFLMLALVSFAIGVFMAPDRE